MKILGFSCFYHDSSACLIVDGEIVGVVAEERYSRIKHDNSFPTQSIKYVLSLLKNNVDDLDTVVYFEKPVLKFERMMYQHFLKFPKSGKVFVDTIGSWPKYKLNVQNIFRKAFDYSGSFEYVEHHTSHASEAYYLSGFDDAVIVTIDGVGEWATTTIGSGEGNKVTVDREIKFPHSLGLLYSAITSFLGFKVNNSEYKVMGLASYGDSSIFADEFSKLISLNTDGSFELCMDYFNFENLNRMYSHKMSELFEISPRKKEGRILKIHKNIAASLQVAFEKGVFNLLNNAIDKSSSKNLCFGGGVALNSVCNGKIIANTSFNRIFIPPDPGDGGAAVGAALYSYALKSKKAPQSKFSTYLGPSYDEDEVREAIDNSGLSYRHVTKDREYLNKISNLIMKGKVVGWFSGRMEWGPRALGARSILASPILREMRDILNKKVKKRESFRPFAPVILEEHMSDYFKLKEVDVSLAKHMLLVAENKKAAERDIPATVHVDNSGRPQSISRKDNKLYYDLIKEFYKKTGVPALINTSFNVRGEPIVNTPQDAINCFLSTGIDVLAIENFIIEKKKEI